MTGPGGMFRTYEKNIPSTLAVTPSTTEIEIIDLRDLARSLAETAGIMRKAVTRIIPAIFTELTTLKLIPISVP